MMPSPQKEPLKQQLPAFRHDLKLFNGPKNNDGSPTFNLYDPLTGQYYQLNWLEGIVIKLAKAGNTAIHLATHVNQLSTTKVSPQDVLEFYHFASTLNLLVASKSSEEILKQWQNKQISTFKWLIHNYLYIRMPLINPDRFLEKFLPYAKLLVSKYALFTYLTLTIIGLIRLSSRFDTFIHTFSYFFNLQGLFFYGATISLIKIIHEFSHAFTAKYFNVYVRTMGVALLVLWPVLYTDVTDGWSLSKRSQRLAISVAGVVSEIVLAGLATFFWTIISPGVLQSALFLVASTTWILSLFINLNPAMRFDGYYILSDIWGIENLRARSFALTAWKMRRIFLGLELPNPEPDINENTAKGMLIYGIFTWTYLMILYTTIAVFVYYQFTKALGIILFIVEVAVFILWPFFTEARTLYSIRSALTWNFRLISTLLFIFLALLWFILPLPHKQTFPAITIPSESELVFVQQVGSIKNIFVKRGDEVKQGDLLIQLENKQLEALYQKLNIDKKIVEMAVRNGILNQENQAAVTSKKFELASLDKKIDVVSEQLKKLDIRSAIDGQVYSWNQDLRADQYVATNEIIGKIANTNHLKVLFFIPEESLPFIKEGEMASFKLLHPIEFFPAKILAIDPYRTSELKYFALSSTYKGYLPVTSDREGHLMVIESYFPALLEIDSKGYPLRFGQVGEVEIKGPSISYFSRMLRHVWQVLIRESGF